MADYKEILKHSEIRLLGEDGGLDPEVKDLWEVVSGDDLQAFEETCVSSFSDPRITTRFD